jgi:hypothetical protein
MIARRSTEEYLAELDDILRRYRLHATELGAHAKLTQEEALARLRKLGFTAGEALRLLRLNSRGS